MLNREPAKILVVDDKVENVMILGDALKEDGHNIVVATRGEQALELATAATQPDLILLDIMMPGMDGYQVCEALKANEHTQHIPIIFVTAMSAEEDEAKGLGMGAVDYITKPFAIPIVKERVKTHVELKRNRDTLIRLSSLDELTELPNRRQFDIQLYREWHRAYRHSDPFSLVMLEFDYYEQFIREYGEESFEDALRAIAQSIGVIKRRAIDYLARHSTARFAFIMPATDLEGALYVARRVERAIHELAHPFGVSPLSDHVTFSMGVVTTIPIATIKVQYIIESVEGMLKQAQDEGGNTIAS